MTALEMLSWDSDFFGVPIARITDGSAVDAPARAAAEADATGIACVYHQVDAGDPTRLAAAQSAGFRVVDVRMELARTVPRPIVPEPDVRLARAEDVDWVVAQAAGRFRHSRFATDPNFAPDSAQRLFSRWAERGFDDPARSVWVADDRTGFVICAYDSEGWIDLIAAREDAPRGTGGRLVRAAFADYAERGLSSAAVVTQAANIGAVRLYERMGYQLRASAYWLHRWQPADVGHSKS